MRPAAALAARCSINSFSELLRVAVVEADVETRARFAGNEIDRRVADVDGGEFQIRGLEMRAALVERLAHQRVDQRDDAAHRIFRAVGIGDMALAPGDGEDAVERAAPPDLDGVAELAHIRRLAEDAMVEFFAARRRPIPPASPCR